MSADIPSGTVTFLFTDIEGSTRLWERFPEGMRLALAQHDEILQRAVEAHGGRIIKNTGDGLHAVFDTAAAGLETTLAAQHALHEYAWSEIQPEKLRVRMGLHTGEAHERAGDYYGPALNRAARLMSVAHGAQTLLSTTTADLVRDQLPDGATLLDLGQHRLKDLVRPEHIFQLVHPALTGEFLPLRSVDAFPNNLPIQLTSFIGREREMAEVRSRLESARLLTLIGPGGTGKTRLSLQLAAEVLPSFPDGVWLAELAPLTDPALVMQSIASIFRLREQLGMPLSELVIDYLRDKELLVVLDNCEHLVEASAQMVDQLLRSCTRLKIIASSREALGIPGETVYRVPPLSLPGPHNATREALAQCESAQLFMERAMAAKPRFALTDQNAAAIAQICRRLDGIPLALELAAARVTTFSAEQIAAHLDDRFRLLTGGSRTALPRQQTLRALIDWSYELLSDQERCLLRKLSVFANGWTFEAAEAVCTDLDVLDLLSQLVNKSLVTVDDEAEEPRYRLLETVRQYARDKLLEAGETEATRNAHFEYFYELARRAEPRLRNVGAAEWVERLDREHDNLRAAAQWALGNRLEDVLRMIQWLGYFWNRRGYEEEARHLINEALRRAESTPSFQSQEDHERQRLLALAWETLAMMAYSQGDNARAVEAAARCADRARTIGDKRLLATALGFQASGSMFLGRVQEVQALLEEGRRAADDVQAREVMGLPLTLMAQVTGMATGDYELARRHMWEGEALMRTDDDAWSATMGMMARGMVAKYAGDYATARKEFLAVQPLFEDLGDQHRVNMIRSELAHLDRYEGRLEQAESTYRSTIREWQRIGHRAAVAHQLESLAFIALETGRHARAARLFGAAEALRERINIPMTVAERREYEEVVARLRSAAEAGLLDKAWSAGRSMSLDDAVRFAVDTASAAPA